MKKREVVLWAQRPPLWAVTDDDGAQISPEKKFIRQYGRFIKLPRGVTLGLRPGEGPLKLTCRVVETRTKRRK